MSSDPEQALESVKQMMSAINCGAALIDRAGTIVHVNGRMCRMLHRKCHDVVGSNVINLYPEESDRAIVREALEHFEEDAETEFFLPLPDGTRLPIISSARQLPGPAPLSDHRLVTMIDISKQKAAERSTRDQYELVMQMSDTVLQQAVELKHYSQSLEQRVKDRTNELRQSHMDAIYMLAVASEAKDQDTGRHVRRIERLSRDLAEQLGFSDTHTETIGYSAILHDVGKIHVPDDVLQKPGPLDERERAQMQLHTLAGERILVNNPFFAIARNIARSHHENWDGSGYPDGLAKDAIPIESRIVHLADVFDALTHERVYKPAWTRERAIESIREASGTMFDPQIVRAFDSALAAGKFNNGNGKH